MVIRRLTLGFLSALLLLGCGGGNRARLAWDGRVEQWGALREVLREGKDEGRVVLSEHAGRTHLYGVGALAGLAGEVTVLGGEFWIARVDAEGRLSSAPIDPGDEQATLLALAEVPRWIEVAVEDAVPAGGLEEFIHARAAEAGVPTERPFPFRVEGGLLALDFHVINTACPWNPARSSDTASEPFFASLAAARGKLVGFFASNGEGTLTHHGSRLHTHVLIEDEEPRSGHVDKVGLAAGAKLYLPAT